MQHRVLTSGAIAAALLVLPLTACGGDDSESGTDGSTATSAEADLVVHGLDSLKFDKSEYEAPAGEITVEYVNDGSILHTLLVEGREGFKLEADSRGETDTGTIDLAAGTYTLFCDVVGHRAGGMEATLKVQ